MKNPLVKKVLPHLVALIVFLLVSILFCRPALEGNVLNQHDTIGWKGMAQNAYEYKEKRQGYFTWALVEGLKGAAANDKKEITLAKLCPIFFTQDSAISHLPN